MKTRFVIFLMLLMPGLKTLAGEPHIRFRFLWQGQQLQLGQSYFWGIAQDSLQLETIRLYVSDVGLYSNSTLVAPAQQKHYLIDASLPESQRIDCKRKNRQPYTSIHFAIGVDSATNVTGAHSGPLDPMNGMYWAWQSGYINFKIEGTSNVCSTRLHRFQLHIGGYQKPFSTLQQVNLPVSGSDTIIVDVALDIFIQQIKLRENNEVMSPGVVAIEMAQKFSTIFKAGE